MHQWYVKDIRESKIASENQNSAKKASDTYGYYKSHEDEGYSRLPYT